MLQSSNEISDTKAIMQGDKSMKYATAFSFIFLFFIGLAEVASAGATHDALGSFTGAYEEEAAAPKVQTRSAQGLVTNSPEHQAQIDAQKKLRKPTIVGRLASPKRPQPARPSQQVSMQNAPISAAECSAKKGTLGPEGYGCFCFEDENSNVKRPSNFPGGVCIEKNKNVVADTVDANDPRQKCISANGSYLSADQDGNQACFCVDGGTKRTINPSAGESCEKSAATGNPQLDKCLQKWETKAEECKTSAKLAVESCNEDKSTDKGAVYVRSFAKDFLNAQLKSKAGTGSASECALGSLIGNTALTGLDSMKTTCSENFETCNKECDEVNEASKTPIIANECGQFAVTNDEQKKMANTISTIINASNFGIDECKIEAKKQKGLLEQSLDAYGKAAQAGKMCECQIAGAGANCNLIPDASKCLPGGALHGQPVCNVFPSCALGSPQYSSTACQCARDSSAAICRTPAGKPAPSNFAVDLKPSANGGVDVGGPAGGGGGDGGMNLGGNYNVNKPGSDYKDPAETAKGGKSGGNGGNSGGGGGARSGGGDDPNALAGGEDDGSAKGGLAGLFNQAKSSFSNMLGGGSKVTGKGLSPNGGGQGLRYDINKWRPRGLASAGCQGNQVRCKNEDIFSIVNRRYDVNEPTFLFGP